MEFLRKYKKYFLYGIGAVILIPILVVVFSFGAIYFGTREFIYDDIEKLPQAQVAVVLGAAILKNGDLSPVLRHRADTAILIYNAKKIEKILVTGNNSTLEYNEVNPVRKYLLKAGIPEEDIFLDHAGFDTYSSMYRARNIFLTETSIVVTQGFHLPRAIYISRSLGVTTYGMKADQGTYLFRNNIRELGADVKAVFNLIFNRQPKYLGEEIPITGEAKSYE